MAASMDKKSVIFPKDYATKETKLSLFAFLDAKEGKKNWDELDGALQEDLGIDVDIAGAQKLATDEGKKPEMVDPYVKVGVAGTDLVFRVKQPRSVFKGGDIEQDKTLVKSYANEKKKKDERWPFKTKWAVDIVVEQAEKKTALYQAFEKHCKERHVEENLEFMVALEELKDAKGQMIEAEKKSIFETFIKAGSKDINIPATSVKAYTALAAAGKYKEMKFDDPRVPDFNARYEVWKMLQNDVWDRTFLTSADFKKVFALPEGAKLLTPADKK